MPETFTIPARFCGPPESGNGGWTSGHLAALVSAAGGTPAVSVRLHSPPPLERAMTVRRHDGGVEVADGDVLVASGLPAPGLPRTGLPEPVPYQVAAALAPGYPGLREHPFPTCFSCGTDRLPEDALRLRPAPVPGRDGVYAAAWVPADAAPETVWAALDCPGAWALGIGRRPMVLGTMTAEVHRLPEPGQQHVVMAWGRGSQGRKSYCGTALYAADGTFLAQADATWIAVDPTTVRPAGSRA